MANDKKKQKEDFTDLDLIIRPGIKNFQGFEKGKTPLNMADAQNNTNSQA